MKKTVIFLDADGVLNTGGEAAADIVDTSQTVIRTEKERVSNAETISNWN